MDSSADCSATTAVVLVSGGMDSCVAAAEAAASGRSLALLHATYGQRTAARERSAFDAIAAHYAVPAARRLVATLEHIGHIGGSALTDMAITMPSGPPDRERIPVTYVPFRNAHLLATAVSWAEVIGAAEVWIGAVEEDSSGYPDCRAVFLEAFERAVREGTRPETAIRIVAPLLHLGKDAIVRRGLELGAPLAATWSCYQASERACGVCESCRLRLRGFARAGARDPIPYENEPAAAGERGR